MILNSCLILPLLTHSAPAYAKADVHDQEDDDPDTAKALQRYKMVDARLRRLCEKKPSGKIQVPKAIHEQWLKGGKERDELRKLLEEYDFDKEQ